MLRTRLVIIVLVAFAASASSMSLKQTTPILAPIPRAVGIAALRSQNSRPVIIIDSLLTLRGGALASGLLRGVGPAIIGAFCVGSLVMLSAVFYLWSLLSTPASIPAADLRHTRWNQLSKLLVDGDRVADGAAASHSAAAREEAARVLMDNHESVLRDITRSDGAPLSQPDLKRLPGAEDDVDAALREVAGRLIGRLPQEQVHRVSPTSHKQAEAWAGTATYLRARIQCRDGECEGQFAKRPADMSEEAGAAMRAVLLEVGAEKPISRLRQTFFGVGASPDTSPMVGP